MAGRLSRMRRALVPHLRAERRLWRQGSPARRSASMRSAWVRSARRCSRPRSWSSRTATRSPAFATPRRCRPRQREKRRRPDQAARPGVGSRRGIGRGDRAAEHLPRLAPGDASRPRADRRLRPRARGRPQDRRLRGPGRAVHVDRRRRRDLLCDRLRVVIAKVTRDRLMASLAVRYPGYGWEQQRRLHDTQPCGRPRDLGLTPYHRRTYARIRAMLEGDQLAFDLMARRGS